MRVLSWHVHGAWQTAFVHGRHDHLVPVTPDRGPDGRGRPGTYAWPAWVREVTPEQLAGEDVDVVVLQRPEEIGLLERWTGLVAGKDVPAVFVEHNTPRGGVVDARHPLAEQSAVPVVHVTHFNDLVWDCGHAPTWVVEHGVPDPGLRWTGTLPRSAAVINEPLRRRRVTGTDLLPVLARPAPVDLFGIGTQGLRLPVAGDASVQAGDGPDDPGVHGVGDIPHERMLAEVARRRVYLHTCRWTSLGLALVEAMHLGMPIVAVAATEAPDALQGSGAVVSTDLRVLSAALERFLHDPAAAAEAGREARVAALRRYSLPRFLDDWDRLLLEVTR
jgi:hypothetical protein